MDKDEFDKWMTKVDAKLEKVAMVTSDDLPDQDWMGMFEDEVAPDEAAMEVLEDEGFGDFSLDQISDPYYYDSGKSVGWLFP